MSGANWIEANQQFLTLEFARLKARLLGDDESDAVAALADAEATMPGPAAIDVLAGRFALSRFERSVLLFCAGVQMDAALAAACAGGRPGGESGASFGIALACLDDPHWSALTPTSPLRRWRLLEVRDPRALTATRIDIDERVLHYLAGINYLDSRLHPMLSACHGPEDPLAPSHEAIVRRICGDLRKQGFARGTIQLVGSDSASHKAVAAAVANQMQMALHGLAADDLPGNLLERDGLATLWVREAALLPSALLIELGASAAHVQPFLARLEGLVFVSVSQAMAQANCTFTYRVDLPAEAEQKDLWQQALGPQSGALNGSLDALATQFRMNSSRITQIARSIAATPEKLVADELWQACKQDMRARLDELAQRVTLVATWDDLVLPGAQLATLHQISAHVKHRLKVYQDWGFGVSGSRGLGITALFSGESGTGKTMAAEVLANDLHLDLYRIDLAAMVSKYIGETEKNLRRVFDAAEQSGAILLFDEADALFGKRSEVNDSRDRYANIEVSYLLQRMESYRGLAILTTNLKHTIDTAFQRRLRFVIQFPFPDSQLRERIWRGAFPAATPLNDVDPRRLAQLGIAGGSIRNIALNAAFLAADAGAPLDMGHLLQAARSEASKRDRPFSEAETRGWM